MSRSPVWPAMQEMRNRGRDRSPEFHTDPGRLAEHQAGRGFGPSHPGVSPQPPPPLHPQTDGFTGANAGHSGDCGLSGPAMCTRPAVWARECGRSQGSVGQSARGWRKEWPRSRGRAGPKSSLSQMLPVPKVTLFLRKRLYPLSNSTCSQGRPLSRIKLYPSWYSTCSYGHPLSKIKLYKLYHH